MLKNKAGWVVLLTVVGLAAVSRSVARDEPPTSQKAMSKAEIRHERERQFKEMLENSILKGSWQVIAPDKQTGKTTLSEARSEQYTIDKVSKASDDYWIINAQVQYAEKDVTIPVTVRVVWAEDTPIITLDKMALPGLGTYSARVMIYRGLYCGTWFGANYGGLLSGQIVKQEKATSAPSH